MRAGSQGERIDELPENGWAVVENYGLLTDLDEAEPWLKAMSKAPNLRIAYIVTDDNRNLKPWPERCRTNSRVLSPYDCTNPI